MKLAATTLTHARVRLEPLTTAHRTGLIDAGVDPAIWAYIPFPVEMLGYGMWFDWLMGEHEAGRWIVHAVVAPDGRVVGQTCYINMREAEAGVEIGGTWYAPDVQGGPINPACKLLLLGHAFDSGAERVEFKTDADNERSRAAILKLGASFEGIHRKHMRKRDGTLRDTAWYSILREEWPGVREKLEARLAAFD